MTQIVIAKGKHDKPTQGHCILEYVAMIAGAPFSDHPECVSRVLRAYAIRINDAMPNDEMRTRLLLPLAPVLMNTADKDKEVSRASFLALWTINKILPIMLRARGHEDLATACEIAATLAEAGLAAQNAKGELYAAAAASTAYAYASAADASAAASAASTAAADAATYAYAAASTAAAADAVRDKIFTIAAEGLKKAAEL